MVERLEQSADRPQHIRQPTPDDSARNTSFETIRLPYGQLGLVNPFPTDFAPGFKDKLIHTFSRRFPTRIHGKTLKKESFNSRWVRKIDVDHIPVIIKGSRFPAKQITHPDNDSYTRFILKQMGASILTQFQKIDTLQREYRNRYDEFVDVEEALGFFIGRDKQHPLAKLHGMFERDAQTHQRFILYRYYPQALVPSNPADRQRYDEAVKKVKLQAARLASLPSFLGNLDPNPPTDQHEDGIQYMITGNPYDGYRGIITDSELWIVGKL